MVESLGSEYVTEGGSSDVISDREADGKFEGYPMGYSLSPVSGTVECSFTRFSDGSVKRKI